MYYGMQTFDQSLLRLYQDGKITLDDAISMAHNAHDFKIKVRQLGLDPGATARDRHLLAVEAARRAPTSERTARAAPAR